MFAKRAVLMTTVSIVAMCLGASQAIAQTATEAPAAAPPGSEAPATAADTQDTAIIVTGSRIRRTNTTTEQPIQVVNTQNLEDRGYINVADAINDLPIIGTPESQQGDQGAAIGRNYINLFNLGSQRTLTLVNGRRFVSGNPAINNAGVNNPGSQVDLNNIPALMINSVEVIQATGAATYGSDAIAGVVNILLKKKFDGVQFSGQSGISSRGDYRTFRLGGLAGTSFANDRGSVVVSYEHSENQGLMADARPAIAAQYTFVPNPADTSRTDGIPASILIRDRRFPYFTANGLPLSVPAPVATGFITIPDPADPTVRVPAQFAADGTLIPYDPGTIYSVAAAQGGDGYNNALTLSLASPVKRDVAYAVGSYELTDAVTLSAELSGAWVTGREVANQSASLFNVALFRGALGAIPVSTSNPFLGDQARALLEAQGISDFFISRTNDNLLLQGGEAEAKSETYRGVLALDGKFGMGDRNFFWNVSGTYGESSGQNDSYQFIQSNFLNAIDVVRGPGGQIVCRVALSDPSTPCRPINLFSAKNDPAALDYINGLFRRTFKQTQTDFQANLTGDVIKLPGGMAGFAIGYEYRRESASSSGNDSVLQGFGRDAPVLPVSGSYKTNEVYGELSLPLVGGDFTLPLVYAFSVDLGGRVTDNSRSGTDEAWNIGGRWTVIPDIVLRASKSRTFRSPSSLELFLPRTASFQNAAPEGDPCDQRFIATGPNPSVRQANCRAAFQALGLSPDFDLASNVSNAAVPVTIGGNPDLRNEVADSWTAGVVLTPSFIPGLTLTADYVDIRLKDAIVNFNLATILSTCYDAPTQDPAVCGLFTRDSQAQVTSAMTGFVNAGYTNFAGITYVMNYDVPLDSIFTSAADPGRLLLNLSLFNTRKLETSLSGLGFDLNQAAGELSAPHWKGQLNIRYSRGPMAVSWFTDYVGPASYDVTHTIEDRDVLRVGSYFRHDASIQFRASQQMELRLGVNNIFDEDPPIAGLGGLGNGGSYDIIGRSFFAAVDIRF